MKQEKVTFWDKRTVGGIKSLRIYHVIKNHYNHFFRMFNGYGISVAILKKSVIPRHIDFILFDIIMEDKSRKFYAISVIDFIANSSHYKDRGRDNQRICNIDDMEEVDAKWLKKFLVNEE